MKAVNRVINFDDVEEIDLIDIKSAIPFYFIIDKIDEDIVGTLSILCSDKNNKRFIIHFSYILDNEYEVDLFKHCNICNLNSNIPITQNIVYTEMVRSSNNYLADLHNINICSESINEQYFIGLELDSTGNVTKNITKFKIDYKLLSIFGCINEYIFNFGLDNFLLDICVKTNYNKGNFIPHVIDNIKYENLSIYKMAPWNSKEKKSSDVLIWLNIKDENDQYSLICRFSLDNKLKKRKFKNISKEMLEYEYFNIDSKIYIGNFMYDLRLSDNNYIAINCSEKLPNNEKTNDTHIFLLSDDIRYYIFDLIEKY